MQTSTVSQMFTLGLTKVQGKVREEQVDSSSISPLKKVFITKQILIKSGLVFNPHL